MDADGGFADLVRMMVETDLAALGFGRWNRQPEA